MAYATVADLEARYGEVPVELADRAAVLLGDAATIIDARVAVDISDQALMERLRYVSCAMVNRALEAAEADAYGVSTTSYTMGPFTQSATFSNPGGDLYLTSGELRLLGAAGTVVGSIRAEVRHA
jgi:hypothetical protein